MQESSEKVVTSKAKDDEILKEGSEVMAPHPTKDLKLKTSR